MTFATLKVVQRNNGGGTARFWRLFATGVQDSVVFGTPTDVIVPGDYDGDGMDDIAVIRGSGGKINWFYKPSGNPGLPYVQHIWGNSATDFPAHGDYNGDGRTDPGIWRPGSLQGTSAFWVYSETAGVINYNFGQNGDYPVANFNSH